MTELLAVPTAVASVATIASLLGAVYQVYLEHPIKVRTISDVLNAYQIIRRRAIVKILEPGKTYDVTPPDARNDYKVEVMGDTKENATGILHISYPDNLGIPVEHSGGSQVTTSGDRHELNDNNILVVGERALDDIKALNIHGYLIHRPPGVSVFPEYK